MPAPKTPLFEAVPAPKTPLFLVCQGTPPPIYIPSTPPPPPLVWNYAGLTYDEPQLSSLELAKFRIFSNVCFAEVAILKRKAREMPHLNMSSNKDPEEQGSNEELEEQE